MTNYFKTLIPTFFSLILIATLLAPIIPVVEVEAKGELHKFYSTPLNVEVRYVHSVEGLPVIEVLTVEGSCIKLSKMLWPGCGAGMPSAIYDMEGAEVKIEGDLFSATPEKCLGMELVINVKYMVNGTVKIGDYVFRDQVKIRVTRVSLASYISSWLS